MITPFPNFISRVLILIMLSDYNLNNPYKELKNAVAYVQLKEKSIAQEKSGAMLKNIQKQWKKYVMPIRVKKTKLTHLCTCFVCSWKTYIKNNVTLGLRHQVWAHTKPLRPYLSHFKAFDIPLMVLLTFALLKKIWV